jgi:hypothetical protein
MSIITWHIIVFSLASLDTTVFAALCSMILLMSPSNLAVLRAPALRASFMNPEPSMRFLLTFFWSVRSWGVAFLLPVVLLGIAILTCFPFVLFATGEADSPESDSESDDVWARRDDAMFLVFLLIF